MYTERFTEVHDILAALAPTTANGTVAAHTTGYVSIADYHRAFVWLHLGQPAGASTIDLAMQQAQDTLGTGAKALTTVAIATAAAAAKAITQAVAGDIGNYLGIEIRSPELDVSNGFYCIQATVTVGTATYTYSLVIFGIVSRYEAVGVTDFQEIIN